MSVQTIAGIPCKFIAGDTVIFTISSFGYPASGWTMELVLSRDGQRLASFPATASGDDYSVTLDADATAKITPGRAEAAAIFTENGTGQRSTPTCFSRPISVLPNPAVSLPKSENQKMLDGCNKAIAQLTASPEASVNFNGQSYTSQNIRDLFYARDRLQEAVDSELRQAGASTRGGAKNILFRFR